MAAHRWWRLTNIVSRLDDECVFIPELDFINSEGVNNDDTSLAIAKAYVSEQYSAKNAFDNNRNSFCYCLFDGSSPGVDPSWWIGYVFPTPVTVTSIGLQMYQSMQSNDGYEWQTADVEYSDDGNTWHKYGVIEPKIAAMDLSYITTPVLTTPVLASYSVKGRSLQDNGLASRFVLINDWQTGDFIQKIVPSSNGDWEYVTSSQNPVLVTHVGADGFAPQSDGGVIPQ